MVDTDSILTRPSAGAKARGMRCCRTATGRSGTGSEATSNQSGRALRRLTIDAVGLHGLYVVIDRGSRPAHRSGRGPCEGDRGRDGVAVMRNQVSTRLRVLLRRNRS